MKLLTDVLDIEEPISQRAFAFVLDADRTLAPVDTGRMVGQRLGLNERIRSVFEARGYTIDAFREHSAIWSGVEPEDYLGVIEAIAPGIELFDVWGRLLSRFRDARVYVVTAGIPQVWRAVLQGAGLGHVRVLGGLHSRLDSYLVTPSCKAAVVARLQAKGLWVMAAGDSEIDLEMLAQADLPLWIADRKGSPRLQRRLHQVPRARRLPTDGRDLGDWPTLDVMQLESLLDARRKT